MPVAGRRDNGAGRVAVRTSRSDLPRPRAHRTRPAAAAPPAPAILPEPPPGTTPLDPAGRATPQRPGDPTPPWRALL